MLLHGCSIPGSELHGAQCVPDHWVCGAQVNSLSLKEERQDPLVRLADDAASVWIPILAQAILHLPCRERGRVCYHAAAAAVVAAHALHAATSCVITSSLLRGTDPAAGLC